MKTTKKQADKRRAAIRALHKESALREREQIMAHLALPPNKRTHFLRVRLPGGGSSL